ncbi:hypothetical protein DIPPA_16637 [Diplonema papillatum]|nr:hypothetical protein DIPPA_16637 [Diplonema papillatum]
MSLSFPLQLGRFLSSSSAILPRRLSLCGPAGSNKNDEKLLNLQPEDEEILRYAVQVASLCGPAGSNKNDEKLLNLHPEDEEILRYAVQVASLCGPAGSNKNDKNY